VTKKTKSGSQGQGPGYDIGYGKPPADGQFAKGVSGNPKGRPKGAKNTLKTEAGKLLDLVRKEAAREITMGPDGERLTMQQAAVRSTMVNAVKGKTQAQRHSTSLILMAEREAAARAEKLQAGASEVLQAAIDLKAKLMVLKANYQRMGECYPDELLKPEDVILDDARGGVVFRFPVGEREIQVWNGFWALKHHLLAEQSLLQEDMDEVSFDAATKEQFVSLDEAYDVMWDLVTTEMWKTWRVAPEDVSGPIRDMEDIRDQPSLGDTLAELFIGMADRLMDLRWRRRVMEVRSGKVTDDNAEVQAFLNATGSVTDDQAE